MRVLQIAPPWFAVPPPGCGGAEQVVSVLTEGLVAAGHDVTLLAAGGSQTSARLWSPLPAPPSHLLGDQHVELAHVLVGYRRRHGFDVVHDHTTTGAALGAIADGPPVVHTLHGPFTPTTSRFYAQVGDRIALVAISHDQAARRPAGLPIAAVVHNAIDVTARPYVADKGDALLFVGRACPDKGPDIAVEVARRVGRPLRMAIKVNEADEHAYFDHVLAPLVASGDVEVVEAHSAAEKAALFASARAVLFPIRWAEPFGLVPVEANASGTPVVAFGLGAVPEVVADGVSGFVVAPGDLDAFCAATERVDELSPAACRAHALARFDGPRMVTDYLRVYEQVVAGPGTTHPDDVHLVPWPGGHGAAAGTTVSTQ